MADPIAIAQFFLTVPYLDPKKEGTQYREVSLGVPFDDNVWNSGGVCHGLENVLESVWNQTKILWKLNGAKFRDPIYDNVIGAGGSFIPIKNAAYVALEVLRPPEKQTEWYGNSGFVKYGWVSEVDTFQIPHNQPAQWWNFLFQGIQLSGAGGGVDIWLNGENSLARCQIFDTGVPPDLFFHGFLGITGSYNDDGVVYS